MIEMSRHVAQAPMLLLHRVLAAVVVTAVLQGHLQGVLAQVLRSALVLVALEALGGLPRK